MSESSNSHMSAIDPKIMLGLMRLYSVWNDEGRSPAHHRHFKHKLRAEWGLLAKSIQELSDLMDARWAEDQLQKLSQELFASINPGQDHQDHSQDQ